MRTKWNLDDLETTLELLQILETRTQSDTMDENDDGILIALRSLFDVALDMAHSNLEVTIEVKPSNTLINT